MPELIEYDIDEAVRFQFRISNKENKINFSDINKPYNFCIGPLSEYNGEFLTYPYSLYLIYINKRTEEKYLLGFIKYKIINDEDYGPNYYTLYLSLSCTPLEYSRKGINFALKTILFRQIYVNYVDDRVKSPTQQIITVSSDPKGVKINVTNKLGLSVVSGTRKKGLFLTVLPRVNRNPIEYQLAEIAEKLHRENKI